MVRPTTLSRGVVVRYDSDGGFGFVRSRGYPDDVFFHISTVVGGQPLHPGRRVLFSAELSPKGPRAIRVEPGRAGLSPRALGVLGLAVSVIAVLIGLLYAGLPPLWAWLGAINAITFAIYGFDKRRASLGGRRVPEAVLLGLALVGGSPGAAAAMASLRHKTRKASFLVGFGVVVLVQVCGLVAWLARR